MRRAIAGILHPVTPALVCDWRAQILNTMSKPSFIPFPNGTSHMIWRDYNCDRCWKSKVNDKTGKSRCAIEYAIAFGSVSDGSLLGNGRLTEAQAMRLAKRLNWNGEGYLETDCPEREEKRPKYPKRQKRDRGINDLPMFT